MECIKIDHKKVALVVRGKKSDAHDPGISSHADCLLPGGEPIGYFGAGGVQTSGNLSASWHSVGLNKKGQVVDYDRLKKVLRRYTDPNIAQATNTVSTVLVMEVDAIEALAFKNYWKNLTDTSDGFRLLGNNCATHASKAFIRAKIISKGIPGLDTPNNLYSQLLKVKGRKMKAYSGFLGHKQCQVTGNTDLLVINK